MRTNTASLVFIIAALAAGGAAAFFTNSYIEDEIANAEARLNAAYERIQVVVARRDLRPGDVLDASTLSIRDVPKGFVHRDAVRPETFSQIGGKALVYALNSGEPLLFSHVSASRGGKFASLIEPGKRALTFPVDVVSSVSGMLSPGDNIDLLATLRQGDRSLTFPMLTNVEILATGIETGEKLPSGEHQMFQTITLMVSPEEASRITHAREEGALTVTLRSAGDNSPVDIAAIDKNALLGIAPFSRQRGTAIEFILGGQ